MLINSFDKIIMKDLIIDLVGSKNRKTVSDLKLKKSMQLSGQDISKINYTLKVKQAKLTPIIGQITVVPIKPESALVKQMLLGKQAVKLQGPLKRLKTMSKFGQSSNNLQTKQYQFTGFNTNQTVQIRNTDQSQIPLSTQLEKQLIDNQKQSQSPKKTTTRVKTLPKIQNQSKYLTQRVDKLQRPILTHLDPNLKSIKSLHFHVVQHETKTPVLSYRSKTKIQVASLTKIMTFFTVYQICQQNSISVQRTQLKISQQMTGIPGTTASLQQGQIYTIEQLLYGMMLPSGNDASTALAIWAGRVLALNEQVQSYAKLFVQRMNVQAKQLKMVDSNFANPHGLPHKNSKTTCQDIAKLCSACLDIPIFRKVVATKLYKYVIYDCELKKKIAFQWQNTNKLLRRPGFIGIKTGITVTAGPCLATAYQFLDKTYIVVLAKCNKPSRRFKQTRKLLVHCLEKIDHGRPLTKEEEKVLKKLGKTNEDIDSDYSQQQVQFNFGTFSPDQIQRRVKILTQI